MNEAVVLITGSSGLIGSRLIERAPNAVQLVGFDFEGPPVPPIQAECVPVDLTDERSVDRALERVRHAYGDRIASVIHLAAYYDFSGEDSPLYDKLTVQGTAGLLDMLRAKRFTVEQFIFSSTMLVHAPCEIGNTIDERHPIDARWPYPQSKVRAERAIAEHRGSIPTLNLRIAGVYDDDCHSIPIAHQIDRILEKKLTAHVFPGDLRAGQAFIHLDDLVDAIWSAFARRASLPEQLDVLLGEPETMSYDELQRSIARLLHGDPEWETREIPKPLAEIGAWIQEHIPAGEEPFIKPWMVGLADDHYALDISRARQMLGWRPNRSLRDTLPIIIDRLKQDPSRWRRENNLADEE